MPTLTYDVVIATRNRPEALRFCIPLLLGQSRKPKRIIVVDSSDDPAPTECVVRAVSSGAVDTDVELIRSEPGTSLQRNIGLRRISSDVAFFPDDNLLVLPGALEAMMRIYELDEDGVIGGVCSAEALNPPGNVLVTANRSYRKRKFEQFKRKIATVRFAAERRLVPDPFMLHARAEYGGRRFRTG